MSQGKSERTVFRALNYISTILKHSHQIQATKPNNMAGTKKSPRLPKGFREWYDRLVHMARHSESEIPAPLLAHIEQPFSPDLPHLNPSDMTLPQTEKAFNIKQANGYQGWMFPSVNVPLSADLGNCYHSPGRYGSVLIMIRSLAA